MTAVGIISIIVWATQLLAQPHPRVFFERGNAKVCLGAFVGEVSVARLGLKEGGDVNALLTPYLGEQILKLGKAGIDFPVCPSIHLAFERGQLEHANFAFTLVNHGANPNMYVVPDRNTTYGFPPAMLFALGFGQTPQNSHAEFVRRMLKAFPALFNLTIIKQWAKETGNPPLVHIPLLMGYFDGVYLLTQDLGQSVNDKDSNGVTPLHIASWQGDVFAAAFLLKQGADRTAVDEYERTPLHYAAMRGNSDIISLLLLETPHGNTISKSRLFKRRYLAMRDKDGRPALTLAALPPSSSAAVRAIRREMTNLKQLPEGKWSRAPLKVAHNRSRFEEENADSDSRHERGGWTYSPLADPEIKRLLGPERADIDTVSASSITKTSFLRDYFSAQRPVVITDHLMAYQRIWAHWRKVDFLDRYGDMKVEVGEKLYAEPGAWSLEPPRMLTIRQWVEESMASPLSERRVSGVSAAVYSWQAENRDVAGSSAWGMQWHDDVQRAKLFNVCGSPLKADSSDTASTIADVVHGGGTGLGFDKGYRSMILLDDSVASTLDTGAGTGGSGDGGIGIGRREGLSTTTGVGEDESEAVIISGGDSGSEEWGAGPIEAGDDLHAANAGVGPQAVDSSPSPPRTRGKGARQRESRAPYLDYKNEIIRNATDYDRSYFTTSRQRGVDYESLKLSLGPQFSGAPLQTHNASWNFLISGRKRWYLVAPGQAVNATGPEKAIGDFSVSTVLQWIADVAPTLRATGSLYEFTQYAGEVVFVPHDWLYATINEADSVAVSQEICTKLNTNQRVQPLGTIIYGGRDKYRNIGAANTMRPFKQGKKKDGMMQINVDGLPVFY